MVRNREIETEQADDGADQPFGLAQSQTEHSFEGQGRRDRQIRVVRLATGVVRGSASQAATAASVNQTVRLPRWRKAASYSAQFATLCFCLGMWWRRSWFSLNGKVGFRGSGAGRPSYAPQPPPPTSRSVQQGPV